MDWRAIAAVPVPGRCGRLSASELRVADHGLRLSFGGSCAFATSPVQWSHRLCLLVLLKRLSRAVCCSLCVCSCRRAGTHNAELLRKAAETLFDICEKRNNAVTDQGSTPSSGLRSSADDIVTPAALPVSFGQLLGMGDHLTYTLSSMGLKVYKYVPYGPVQVTIPYLLRRAQENVGMMGGAGRELRFVFDEVKRRLRRGG